MSTRNTSTDTPEADLLIDGRRVSPEEGYFEVLNPSTGERVGRAASASQRQVDDAVRSARERFTSWRERPGRERGELLEAVEEEVHRRKEEIARLLTLENGKPLDDARGEVDWTREVLRFFAGEAERIQGSIPPGYRPERRSFVLRQPVGVIAAIAPWNFPVDLLCWKMAPALAAGCTVVAKPSPVTPLAASLFAECFREAGFPDGAVNVVTGPGARVGSDLVGHPKVDKVGFTGSVSTGKQILSETARNVTPTNLELGGHAPVIVLEDADLDRAVPDTVRRSFSHSGQICHSLNHILVHRRVAEEYRERFVESARDLVVADGLENPGADMGPMTRPEGIQRVEEHIRDAVEKGARLLVGGERMVDPPYDRGYYFPPTVLDGVTGEMKIAREEVFGPVAPITVFEDEQRALQRANGSPYGLVGYLYTEDVNRLHRISEKLEVGTVGVNNCSAVQLNAPYGGWKDSGFGVELSGEAVDEYLKTKHVAVDLEE